MEVISSQNAEHYIWGGNCNGWHLLNQPTLSIIQERVPPGGMETRHYHKQANQFFFILSGIATLEIDGVLFTLTTHQGIEIPPGTPHRFMNQSSTDVVFLVISQPHSHGDRVNEQS
jgi:mannose-6-phosphate isomerase-like protein (cupin superfamily)